MVANSTELDTGRRLKALEDALYNLQRERRDAPQTEDNCPTGTIAAFLSATPPQGWLLLDGSVTVTATTHPALHAYLTANGLSTTLPDFTGRFLVGAGGTYTATSTGGTADLVVPSHTHPGFDHNHGIDANTTVAEASGVGLTVTSAFADRVIVAATVTDMTTGTDGAAYNTGSTGVSGTGANLPPYQGAYWMIRT